MMHSVFSVTVFYLTVWLCVETFATVDILGHLKRNLMGDLESQIVENLHANLSKISPLFHLYFKDSNYPLYSMELHNLRGPDPPKVHLAFKSARKLKIIIHGFKGSSDSDWVKELTEIYTNDKTSIVLTVDWRKGARLKKALSIAQDYSHAASYVPSMGRAVAVLISRFIASYEINPFHIECIGFSLGGQIGGYLTHNLMESDFKIAKFVALDVAAPMFIHRNVLPAKENVGFLEAIHSSASDGGLIDDAEGYFGIKKNFGHVDFYINGGKKQPGCGAGIGNSCSHKRAHVVYIEALRNSNCRFTGSKCDSFDDAIEKRCNGESNDKYYIGMSAKKCSDKPCIFSVTTNERPPYCQGDGDDY